MDGLLPLIITVDDEIEGVPALCHQRDELLAGTVRMVLSVIVHQRQVAVRGERGGGRLCCVRVPHAHHQQEHHHKGVLVKAAAGVRRTLPVILRRGNRDLLFRHIGVPAGISTHQGAHDLLQPLCGKGDLPVLTDGHALRQDDLRTEGNAVRQGGLRRPAVCGVPVIRIGNGLHGIRRSAAGGDCLAARRKADGGQAAHHQNAGQKAGDHALKLHPVHPPCFQMWCSRWTLPHPAWQPEGGTSRFAGLSGLPQAGPA